MSGFRTAIKSQWILIDSMPVSSFKGPRPGCTSSATWASSCFKKQVDIFVIWNGVTNSIRSGDIDIQRLPCVQVGTVNSHRVNCNCGSGFVYTTRPGLDTSGLMDSLFPTTQTALLHQSAILAYPNMAPSWRRWTCIPWTRGPTRTTAILPSNPVCLGKTSRRWRGRQSQPRRRRRYRRVGVTSPVRRPCRRKLSLLYLLLCHFIQCPWQSYMCSYLHWHCLLDRLVCVLHQRLSHMFLMLWARSGDCPHCVSQGTLRKGVHFMASERSSEIEDRMENPGRSAGEPAPAMPPTRTTSVMAQLIPAPPLGPPPPRPVVDLQPVAHRISGAVSQAFAEMGLPVQEVLTLVPWHYRELRSLVVRITHMTPADSFHPNILMTATEEEPGEETAEHTEEPSAGTRAVEETAESISSTMEAEGRTMMTGDEVRRLQAHLEDAPGDDLEDLSAVGSTSDIVTTAALNAAPHGPWHPSTEAKAKPRSSRKFEPHLMGSHTHYPVHHLCSPHTSSMHSGADTVIAMRRPAGEPMCSLQDRADQFLGAGNLLLNGGQLDKKTLLRHMIVLFMCIMLRLMLYMMMYFYMLQRSLWARYRSIGTVSLNSSSSLTLRRSGSFVLQLRRPFRRFRTLIFTDAFLHEDQVGTVSPKRCLQKQHLSGCPLRNVSRTGPKSGHQHSRPRVSTRILVITIWLCLVHTNLAVTELIDARVGADSAAAPEAATAAKPSGVRKASVPFKNTQPHRHVKRAYKRAFARSCREGGAHYRGRWRPMAWFEKTNLRTPSLHLRSTTQSSCQLERGRTHGSYVPGDRDLCQDGSCRYSHVAGNQVESTWASQDYLYVHTAGVGKHDRLAGLLMMISTRLVKAEQLQYCVHHAGRLLHARIPHGHTHVDIINWYQYAVNQQEGTFDRRQKLLIKLQKCLAHLPRRNSLILGGDFNCPCEQHANVCGPACIPPNPMYHADHSDHQQVWRTLHLTALNTWIQPQHGQLATFVFEGTEHQPQSQIDFIMIRSHHCTARSKQAGIIVDFPVAAWRNGDKHYPVHAEVPVPRPQWNRRPAPAQPVRIDQDRLIQELRADPPPPALQALRYEAQQKLQHSSQPIEDSNLILSEVAQKYYPATAPATSTASNRRHSPTVPGRCGGFFVSCERNVSLRLVCSQPGGRGHNTCRRIASTRLGPRNDPKAESVIFFSKLRLQPRSTTPESSIKSSSSWCLERPGNAYSCIEMGI